MSRGKVGALIIPDSVTLIPYYSFVDCYQPTSVKIGRILTTIAEGTNSHCISLISITVGENVNVIENFTFFDCPSLKEIIFLGDAPACGEYWVYDYDPELKIYYSPNSTGFTTPT